MAHFAEIDENNVVMRVVVVPDEQEHRGNEFLSVELGLGGKWIQTSYNHRIRKTYAGIGCIYLENEDIFIYPQPYPSWSLDANYDWQPPKPKPEGVEVTWNEEIQEWVGISPIPQESKSVIAELG